MAVPQGRTFNMRKLKLSVTAPACSLAQGDPLAPNEKRVPGCCYNGRLVM